MRKYWLVVIFLGGLALSGCSDSPEAAQKRKDRQKYELCMKDFNDELKSAGERDFIRGVCRKLRDEYVQKYQREP